MSAIANIVDGQLTNNGKSSATSSISKAIEASNKEAGGSLDKDAFLKLLVTQMQYQDPLEPTDNTEYISQLASFSTLEEMQNMSATMDKQSASSLVGQYVTIEETSATGETKTYEGVVDYVTFSGSKVYLSVEGTLYDYDDLQSVADADYTLAVKLADTFVSQINKLPDIPKLTDEDIDAVGQIVEAYSNMNSYQKSFLSEEELGVYGLYADWYKGKVNPEAAEASETEATDTEAQAATDTDSTADDTIV